MKICILEICPCEPSENHQEVFGKSGLDYFYVSYAEAGANCIKFNKNKSWAHNRNSLYQHVKGKYDFYFFVDYDIILEAKDGSNPIEKIITRLKVLNPAMYRPSGFRGELKLNKGLSVGGFINHSVTIFHRDIVDLVFDLPTKYGGFWDAASFINSVIVPIYEDQTFVDYDIIAHNTQSSKYFQNRIPFIGHRAMNKLFLETKPFYLDTIPEIKNVKKLKAYYDSRRKEATLPIEKCDPTSVDPNKFINIKELKMQLLR